MASIYLVRGSFLEDILRRLRYNTPPDAIIAKMAQFNCAIARMPHTKVRVAFVRHLLLATNNETRLQT
jgi:hypothetical protein